VAFAHEKSVAAFHEAVQHQVVGDVQIGNHTIVDGLVNRDDTLPDRVCGIHGVKRLTGQQHTAAVGAVMPADHLDQRGFACAVRPHENGHGPRFQGHINPAQYMVFTERFLQTVHSERIDSHSVPPLMW
jgi:hypothetical protein